MNEFKFYRALAIINCVPLTVFTCLDNDFIIRGNFKTRLYIDRCIEVQIQEWRLQSDFRWFATLLCQWITIL